MSANIPRLESAVRAAAKQNGLMLRKARVKGSKDDRLNIYGLTDITTNSRVIGHNRMGGRGVSLEVCAQMISEFDPSFNPCDFLESRPPDPAVMRSGKQSSLSDKDFDKLMDHLILTADDEGAISRRNFFTRMAKLDQLMQKQFGENWEFFLSYNFAAIPSDGDYRKMKVPLEPYGKLRGASLSAMLERMDRRGRLVTGLRVEEVQSAAARENELRAAGEKAGRTWATEVPPPSDFNSEKDIPNHMGGASAFGVVTEYKTYGKSWFEGFIHGLKEGWKTLPPNAQGRKE